MCEIELRAEEYRSAVKQYAPFDASLWWAPEYVDTFAPQTSWEAQLEDHARHGIKGGLVTVAAAKDYEPVYGNAKLPELLRGHDTYYGCAVLTPAQFFRPAEGRDYLKKLKDERVVAARIFPGQYNHVAKGVSIDRICDALEDAGMALILWHIDMGWENIENIVARHPGLNVVVDSMDRKILYHGMDYIPMLQHYKNLHLITHNLVLFREYDHIAELGGAQCMLYGSYAPYMNTDFSLYPVHASQLSDAEKQAIYSGNAKRVFNL